MSRRFMNLSLRLTTIAENIHKNIMQQIKIENYIEL